MSGNGITTSPSEEYVTLTASADVLSPAPRALYIATTGSYTVEDFHGNSVVFANAQAGSVLPIACRKITVAAGAVVGLI